MPNPEKKNFQINGTVVNRQNKLPAADLLIEAWDKDLNCNAKVGQATTDEQGTFNIRFELDRQPNLFFKIFDRDLLVESTENALLCRVAPGRTEVALEVGSPLDEDLTRRFPVVLGQVTNANNGYPITGTRIMAYWASLPVPADSGREEEGPRNTGQLSETVTDTSGRFRFILSDISLADLARGDVSLIVLTLEDEEGVVYYTSETIPVTSDVISSDLQVPLPLPSIEDEIWEDFGHRVKQSRIFRIHDLVRQLALVPQAQSAFNDWDLATRHAILAELEQAFLDPEALLHEYGPVPGFYAIRQPGVWEGYQEQLQPHLENSEVQYAFDQMAAKLNSFADLGSVDWVINPDKFQGGGLGQGLTFFQDYYAVNGDNPAGPDPNVTDIFFTSDLDLVNYRDYLRALWVDLATSKIFSDPPVATDATAAVALLEKRFHQNFETADTSLIPVYKLLVTVLKNTLLAPAGNGYGFGISASTIEEQGQRTDREYVDYLVDLSGVPVEEIERRYRLNLQRPEQSFSSAVQENIFTLQRFFTDTFQCETTLFPVVPAKLQGKTPFFLEYEEWLGKDAPFYGENYYQFRQPITLQLSQVDRGYIKSRGESNPEWKWVAQILELEETLQAGLADFTSGQYTLALENYWKAHSLARITLGSDEQGVRERFQARLNQPVNDPIDVTEISQSTFSGPTVNPHGGVTEDYDDWLGGCRTALKFRTRYAYLYGIPTCIAETAFALGDYRMAVSAYSWLTGFFVGLAESSDKPGYYEYAYYDDAVYHFDGNIAYTGSYYSGQDMGRRHAYAGGSADKTDWFEHSLEYGSGWRQLYPTHPIEEAFFRLRQGEALLQWADSLYRTASSPNIARARELYKAVLWLHFQWPPICAAWTQINVITIYGNHQENPALTSQRARALLRFHQIEAGLNYYGYTDEYVPVLRYRALREAADRFANLALSAQQSFLTYMQNVEEARIEALKTANMLQKAQLQGQLAQEQMHHAQGEVKLAELQVKKVKQAIEAKKKEIEDKDGLFTQFKDFAGGFIKSYKDITEIKGPDFEAIGASLQSGAGYQGLYGYGIFVGASYLSLSSMADAYNGLKGELKTLMSEALPVAELMMEMKQREVNMAQLQERIAQADADLAMQLLSFQHGRFLNIEFWSNLADLMRRVMRRYLELGAQFAWLAERALAFEQGRTLNLIRFDYFPVQRQGVSGADMLKLDLAELETARLEGIQVTRPIKHTFSLARDFPLQFGQLKKTGHCLFRTEEIFFRHAYPGTYGYRLKAVGVRIEQIGAAYPIRGSLINEGISTISRLDQNGKQIFKTITHAVDAVPMSEFQISTDMKVHALPDEALLPFEGSGVDTFWRIEIPAIGNPQGLDPMVDILLIFNLQAYYSPDLHQKHLASQPTKVRRFIMISASSYDPENLEALQGNAAIALLRFPLHTAGLPEHEKNRKVKNMLLLVVGEPTLSFNASLSITQPAMEAKISFEENMVISNAPPLGDPQSTIPPSPLNSFVDHTADQGFHLTINKNANQGISFGHVKDILLGVEYEADIA